MRHTLRFSLFTLSLMVVAVLPVSAERLEVETDHDAEPLGGIFDPGNLFVESVDEATQHTVEDRHQQVFLPLEIEVQGPLAQFSGIGQFEQQLQGLSVRPGLGRQDQFFRPRGQGLAGDGASQGIPTES